MQKVMHDAECSSYCILWNRPPVQCQNVKTSKCQKGIRAYLKIVQMRMVLIWACPY